MRRDEARADIGEVLKDCSGNPILIYTRSVLAASSVCMEALAVQEDLPLTNQMGED